MRSVILQYKYYYTAGTLVWLRLITAFLKSLISQYSWNSVADAGVSKICLSYEEPDSLACKSSARAARTYFPRTHI